MDNRITTKEYEQWWENHSKTELGKMRENFGEWDNGRKRYPRLLIKKMGYHSILYIGAGFCSEYYGFKNDYPSIEYTAVEITPTFVRLGKDRGINIIESSAEELSFEDNSFDVVYIRDTLRHLNGYEKAITEALRVARKEVMIVFGRQCTNKGEHVIEYKKDHQIYNNMYSAPLLRRFIFQFPNVQWYCFETVEGWKDASDSIVRIFKNISVGDKKRLKIYSSYPASRI